MDEFKESKKYPLIEQTTWESVREKAHKINPSFAERVDHLKPDDQHALYLIRYPFGSSIIDEGSFFIPISERKLVTINDPNCPKELRQQLGYNAGTIPLGLILNHSVELYLKSDNRIIPFASSSKGKILGLWSILNLPYTARKAWNMTAGARTIFLLPKITDTPSYKKLSKARGIKLPMPRTLLEQGPLLTEITRSQDFPSEWYTEILLFPESWSKPHSGEAWGQFHLLLHDRALEGMGYWCNKMIYDAVWHSFIRDLSSKNVKILPHIIDIVEHIIRIGVGVLPGFVPASDEESGPIEALKNDFLEIYGLKNFAPIIMVPKHITEMNGKYIYWSMQLPTYFESTPRPKAPSSILSDLKEIKFLLEKFRQAILSNKISAVLDTSFYDFMKKVRFDFFHSDVDSEEDGIRPVREMVKEDNSFIKSPAKYGRRKFSEVSPFVRGCARISFNF